MPTTLPRPTPRPAARNMRLDAVNPGALISGPNNRPDWIVTDVKETGGEFTVTMEPIRAWVPDADPIIGAASAEVLGWNWPHA